MCPWLFLPLVRQPEMRQLRYNRNQLDINLFGYLDQAMYVIS